MQIIIDILQNSSETMALASSNGDAKASLPSFARTLIIYIRSIFNHKIKRFTHKIKR